MIIQENEVIMLVLSVGALAAIGINFKRLELLPHRALFLSSFMLFCLASLFTNLEAIFWPVLNNVFEHLSYAISGILFATWCFLAGKPTG